MKSTEALFELAKAYDESAWIPYNEKNLTIVSIYQVLESILSDWIITMPSEKIEIMGKRMKCIIDCIVNYYFTIESINIRQKEITIMYSRNDTDIPKMRVSITPSLILVEDIEHNFKEIAFPLHW